MKESEAETGTPDAETQQPAVTEKDLPSLNLVYPLAMESYETTRQRMVTQDNRIQQIITLTLAITGAIPAIYQIFGIHPSRPFLAIAGLCFLIGMAALVIAVAKNKLCVRDVSDYFDNHIDKPEFVTKVSLIKYAGQDFTENTRSMATRHKLILCAIVCLALEALFLFLSGLWCYKPSPV